jgi:hypothetical protein
MIARPEDFPTSGSSSPDLSGAETPLQRQIILWQHELLRRAERRIQADSRTDGRTVAEPTT